CVHVTPADRPGSPTRRPGRTNAIVTPPPGSVQPAGSAINLFVPAKLQTDFNHEWTRINTNKRKAESSAKTARAPSAAQYGIEGSSVIRVNSCPFVVHRQDRRISWPNAKLSDDDAAKRSRHSSPAPGSAIVYRKQSSHHLIAGLPFVPIGLEFCAVPHTETPKLFVSTRPV